MKGLYFYKLTSPYQEDVTKECKLTVNEIDHNFVTLKNTDIKDITFDEETGLLTLSQINGDKFIAKIDLSHFTRDFNVEWDKENSALIFKYDGKEVIIDELVSTIVDNSITNIVQEIVSQTITDNTLVGVGVGKDPLGINSLELTGAYRAVERLINKIEGEHLPNEEQVKKGDRYLSYEKLNLYGNLYNFDAVKKINEDLKNGWRVPTKEDWDNMLNAIELCDRDKTHDSKICNINAGKYAGKLLKNNEYWKLNDDNNQSLIVCDDGCLVCVGDEPNINPNITKGVDAYGFSVFPSGYGNGYGDINCVGEQSKFWTITETERTDVYTKCFFYNKTSLVQIAEAPNALCSLRLVKDYDGNNFKGVETVNGVNYQTVLMPSYNSKYGYAIWLASNVAFDNERYNPITLNQDEIITDKEAYYLNEWDGFSWMKKRFVDGDSVVIKVGPDGDNYREYQLIDGHLVNIKQDVKKELSVIVDGVKNELTNSINNTKIELQNNIQTVNSALTNSISDNKAELQGHINFINDKFHSSLNKVESNLKIELNGIDENLTTLESLVKENEQVVSSALNNLHIETKTVKNEFTSLVNDTKDKLYNDLTVVEHNLTSLVNDTKDKLHNDLTVVESNLTSLVNETKDKLHNDLTVVESNLTSLVNDTKDKLHNDLTVVENELINLNTITKEELKDNLDSLNHNLNLLDNIIQENEQVTAASLNDLHNELNIVENELTSLVNDTKSELQNNIELNANIIKQNENNYIDSSTISFNKEKTSIGTNVTSNVKLQENKVINKIQYDNVILNEKNGLFFHTNTVLDGNKLLVNINGDIKTYTLPDYLISGEFNKEKDELVLTTQQGNNIIIPLQELISISDNDDNIIVKRSNGLYAKIDVKYNNNNNTLTINNGIEQKDLNLTSYQQQLFNDKTTETLNMVNVSLKDTENKLQANIDDLEDKLVLTESKLSLSAIDSNTIRHFIQKNDNGTSLNSHVVISNDSNNIIRISENGIYANILLDYNKAHNKLILKTSSGQNEISLSDHSLVDNAYYDSIHKQIVLVVKSDNEQAPLKEVKIDVNDLFNPINVENNVNSPIVLTKSIDAINGVETISANIQVAAGENLIKVQTEGSTANLFASNNAQDIKVISPLDDKGNITYIDNTNVQTAITRIGNYFDNNDNQIKNINAELIAAKERIDLLEEQLVELSNYVKQLTNFGYTDENA